MDPLPSALLTDLYQMTMIEAYLESGQTDTAVFEFFVRKLPPQRSFLMAAGLEQALDFLQNIRFSQDELGWLERTEKFSKSLIDYLANFRFTGEVHAMPEGTVFFGNEPILRVTAPLPEAQLVETRLINILHFQTLIASKAARMVLLAPDKLLVDFGLRRSHGAEAGLLAARASYVAGFSGTATLLAEKSFGIPTYGTMAHSFVQSFDDEATAFEAFARARPENLVLLIDTYDTEAAARKVVMLAPRLKELGIAVSAVRLDSGDLSALAKKVRCILDSGGLKDTGIFVSGGIEEGTLIAFARDAAPIDGIGIGTGLVTSSDAPALDCAYKLQEYAGLPRRKRSTGKATWPGRKQVWRRYDRKGRMLADILSTEEDQQEGETLIQAVMLGGRPIASQPSLHDIRAHARRQLDQLPPELRTSKAVAPYPVQISSHLEQLAAVTDRIGSRP
ncbi:MULTISPECIES: nicotinate phosphoribosyltransferase [unclassified Bradyrhizobium]|uniref:nicotinate phosphoribosyltransferase n=2 Tax=unclassified Bradyrhizobium TaxID=2631580 RepID=UPI002915CE43|nr:MULTISPECIES: nicotinate phosphoribosyltransferase [unclassified Bradyrhizobium]